MDRYCFGMSCVRLFTIIEEHWLVHLLDVYHLKPRILALGDYATWNDLPSSSLHAIRQHQTLLNFEDSPEEDAQYVLERLYPVIRNPVEDLLKKLLIAVWDRLLQNAPRRVKYQLNYLTYLEYPWLSGCPQTVKKIQTEMEVLRLSLADFVNEKRGFVYSRINSTPTAKWEPYALCNYSKKTFVLQHPFITTFDECIGEPGILTLAHVALSQCCRSEDSSVAMSHDVSEELVNGPWAGDELKIVSAFEFRMMFRSGKEDAEEWKNDGGRIAALMWICAETEGMLWALEKREKSEVDEWKDRLMERVVPGETVQEILGGEEEAARDALLESEEKKRRMKYDMQSLKRSKLYRKKRMEDDEKKQREDEKRRRREDEDEEPDSDDEDIERK